METPAHDIQHQVLGSTLLQQSPSSSSSSAMASSIEATMNSIDDEDSECTQERAISQTPDPVRAAEVLQWLACVEPYAFFQKPKIGTAEQAEDSDKKTIDSRQTSSLSSDQSYVNELTVKGLLSFGKRKYDDAVVFFQHALEIAKECTGECSFLHYKYALALLYEVRLPGEDLMMNVPKEEDYQPIVDDDGAITVSRRDGNFLECYEENRDSSPPLHRITSFLEKIDEGGNDWSKVETAEDELKIAWSIEANHRDSMAKVDILSAIAEMAYMKLSMEESKSYYQKAYSILERVVEPNSLRLAHIKYKICLCLELSQQVQEAMKDCQQAANICMSRQDSLWSQVDISSCDDDHIKPSEDNSIYSIDSNLEVRDYEDSASPNRSNSNDLNQNEEHNNLHKESTRNAIGLNRELQEEDEGSDTNADIMSWDDLTPLPRISTVDPSIALLLEIQRITRLCDKFYDKMAEFDIRLRVLEPPSPSQAPAEQVEPELTEPMEQ